MAWSRRLRTGHRGRCSSRWWILKRGRTAGRWPSAAGPVTTSCLQTTAPSPWWPPVWAWTTFGRLMRRSTVAPSRSGPRVHPHPGRSVRERLDQHRSGGLRGVGGGGRRRTAGHPLPAGCPQRPGTGSGPGGWTSISASRWTRRPRRPGATRTAGDPSGDPELTNQPDPSPPRAHRQYGLRARHLASWMSGRTTPFSHRQMRRC